MLVLDKHVYFQVVNTTMLAYLGLRHYFISLPLNIATLQKKTGKLIHMYRDNY